MKPGISARLCRKRLCPRGSNMMWGPPLHPGSIGPIWRAIITRAFTSGALPDLTADDLARLLKGVSAHSTRVGLNQDLFASGEDLAGIMDALRWKSPRMPLAYNRNLAAEAGAAGRLMAKLGWHEGRTDRKVSFRVDTHAAPAFGRHVLVLERRGRMPRPHCGGNSNRQSECLHQLPSGAWPSASRLRARGEPRPQHLRCGKARFSGNFTSQLCK